MVDWFYKCGSRRCFVFVQKRYFVFLAVFFGSWLFSSIVLATNHALLIGIGNYPCLGPSAALEGPAYDIPALEAVLQQRYHFESGAITTLVDEQADGKSILAAIDRLSEKTKPGDFVLLYFSGHGTSAYDQETGWAMSPYTGALLPADFSIIEDRQAMLKRMLIGTRDLRPRLEQLEKKCRLLVCIDACHSGYTVRSAARDTDLAYRYVDLDRYFERDEPFAPATRSVPHLVYPYRNTMYLAASSSYEKAFDINNNLIRKGHTTFDGKPHGAFTNALLDGLSGSADSNLDDNISIGELYAFVRKKVTIDYPQTPQLLKPEGAAIDSVVFSARGRSVLVTPISDGEIAHSVASSGARPPDKKKVTVEPQPAGAGSQLVDAANKSYAQELNLEIDPAGSVLVEGQTLGIRIEHPAPVYLLVLGVGVDGGVELIYPWTASEITPIESPLYLPELGRVSGPSFGREYLVAFGFRQKPSFMARLVNRYGEGAGQAGPLTGDSRLINEIVMAAQDGGIVGGSVLPITTCRREDIVKR